MTNYVCSRCGSGAYYDGRCGDGPVLMCKCVGTWVDDGRGGYMHPRGNAKAIPEEDFDYDAQAWANDKR